MECYLDLPPRPDRHHQLTFTFDNNAPQTITSNVPTAGLFPIMIMTTQAASAEFAEVDFFAMKWRGLGR